jgi:thiol-disulfide isomerase/thioredoxin
MGRGAAAGLLAVTAAAALLAGCSARTDSPQPVGSAAAEAMAVGAHVFPVAQRDPLPRLVGRSLSGRRLAVNDLTGKGILVVNVWASWCDNCRDESAALAALSRTLAPEGVSFLGIDEQDSSGAARRFVATSGTTYPQLTDPSGSALRKLTPLPSLGIPSTLIVDRRGMMAARVIGPVRADVLRALVEQISAEA